ncbi:hypothetical protein [Kitasatospora sp. NPDC059571]|uniref:hypothetical protein n=1 Tax=Kitasatospora sp. NPDC059571 TaxID=3346871 RepID=UPI003690B81A
MLVAVDPGLGVLPLWWSAGRILSKDPSDPVVAEMCEVAKVQGAKVQGDDGEHDDA